ncbi:MAG: phage major capsid protein [Candidatus Omnitrophota bacterium]
MYIPEEKINSLPVELHRAANLRLHEGLYAEACQRGLDLSGYLEALDPSPSHAELDAYERQLALAGIRVNGPDADIVDRFFASQESAVLFPEFVSRSVRAGIEDFSKLKNILAARIKIDDNTYKSIYMDDSVMSEEEKRLALVTEGASLPKIEIVTAEHTVTLSKYGRYLEATYEAIRRKRTSIVAIFLRSIGVQIQRDKFADAVNVLINGDGNGNAASTSHVDVSGTIDYEDLVEFALSFAPYQFNVMICNKAAASKILNITELKDPAIAEGFQTRGENLRIFGAELIVDESVPDNQVIGLDRRYALQEVYETGVLTESERLIRRQIEGAAISEVAGFAKVIASASQVLNLTFS